MKNTLPTHLVLILLLLLLIVAAASAKTDIPAPGPPPSLTLPPTKVMVIDNGLEVVLLQQPDARLAYLQLVIKGGETLSPAQMPGLATLASDVLKGGTVKKPGAQIVAELDALGASLETSASDDYSSITCSFLPEHLDRVLAIVREFVVEPVFPKEPFDDIKAMKAQSLKGEQRKGMFVALEQLFGALFKGHPYAVSGLSAEAMSNSYVPAATLSKAQLKDVQAFHSAWYRPNNAILSLSGNLGAPLVEKSVKSALGDWKKAPLPALSVPALPVAEPSRIIVIDVPRLTQSLVLVGKMLPVRSTPAWLPLVIANQVLGGDVGTRLNQAVVAADLKAGGISSSLNSKKSAAYLLLSGRSMTESTAGLLKVFIDQLGKIGRDEVSFNEMDRAKSFLTGNLPLQLESSASDPLATLVMYAKIYDLPGDYWGSYSMKLQQVGRQELMAACQKHLAPEGLSIVVVGDGKKITPGLKEIAPVETLTVEAP